MKKALISASIFALSGLATCAHADGPRWTYVEASYAGAQLDGVSGFHPTGFEVEGFAALADNFLIGANYSSVNDDLLNVDTDLNRIQAFLGYRFELSNTTDAYALVSYQDYEVEASANGVSASADEDGFGVHTGIRYMASESLEMDVSLNYANLGDDFDTSIYASVGATYFVIEDLAIGAGFELGNELETYRITARYAF